MRPKAKIDWDTVELVDTVPPFPAVVAERVARSFPDRRGRSIVKQILSGAAQKARARGAAYTHTQLRKLLPVGLETLIYGWRLVAAAVVSDRDLSRSVELAAQAISDTACRVPHR